MPTNEPIGRAWARDLTAGLVSVPHRLAALPGRCAGLDRTALFGVAGRSDRRAPCRSTEWIPDERERPRRRPDSRGCGPDCFARLRSRPFSSPLFIAGLIQIALGMARAGFVAAFFPSAVIKGLLAAIGVILILKQIPHVVGHDPDPEGDMAFCAAGSREHLHRTGEDRFRSRSGSRSYRHRFSIAAGGVGPLQAAQEVAGPGSSPGCPAWRGTQPSLPRIGRHLDDRDEPPRAGPNARELLWVLRSLPLARFLASGTSWRSTPRP